MLNNFGEICRQKAQTWRENATTPTRQGNPLGFARDPIPCQSTYCRGAESAR